jgi:lysophospholipase L1-like esterase
MCVSARAAQPLRFTAASSPQIRFVGRAVSGADGSLSFDWSGCYFTFCFEGTACSMRVSDTKRNYYNVTVDGVSAGTVTVEGETHSVPLASGLSKGVHTVVVQKRTEAEQGRTTLYGVETNGPVSNAPAAPGRHIECIGDSHTCGYGTEGLSAGEPFTPETENCDLAWGCIAARYFDADYTLIAHSGMGIVRNWGDKKVASEVTMRERLLRTFDEEPEPLWNFAESGYTPDIVVIKLGTNDFSTDISPSEKIFNDAYAVALRRIREVYGRVPVLCVAPSDSPEIWGYLQDFENEQRDPDLHIAAMMPGITNRDSDMGANFHPNHEGQRKMAMSLIPYISTITGWNLSLKSVE